MADHDSMRQREFLLVTARAHLFRTPAVDDRHLLSAEFLGLYRSVNGCHAATYHGHTSADRQCGQVCGLAESFNERNRVLDAIQLILASKSVHSLETETQEDRIKVAAKTGQGKIPAEHLPATQLDASHTEDPVDLGLGEIVRRLIRGDSVFVQAAWPQPAFEYDHLIAKGSQLVSAGEAGRSRADHRNALTRPGALPIELPA